MEAPTQEFEMLQHRVQLHSLTCAFVSSGVMNSRLGTYVERGCLKKGHFENSPYPSLIRGCSLIDGPSLRGTVVLAVCNVSSCVICNAKESMMKLGCIQATYSMYHQLCSSAVWLKNWVVL